jgi:hypothetical protein
MSYISTTSQLATNLKKTYHDKIRKETDFIEVINFSLLIYVKKNILDTNIF